MAPAPRVLYLGPKGKRSIYSWAMSPTTKIVKRGHSAEYFFVLESDACTRPFYVILGAYQPKSKSMIPLTGSIFCFNGFIDFCRSLKNGFVSGIDFWVILNWF